MKNTKFIIAKDKSVIDKLKIAGFQVVSEGNGVSVFLNAPPQNFNFDNVDLTKVGFTNILSI